MENIKINLKKSMIDLSKDDEFYDEKSKILLVFLNNYFPSKNIGVIIKKELGPWAKDQGFNVVPLTDEWESIN